MRTETPNVHEGKETTPGFRVLFDFSGGAFTFPMTWLMGLVVYVRIIIVAIVLYRWWSTSTLKLE